MTKKQQQQFNAMVLALRRISKDYQTPNQIRRSSKGDLGLDYSEALEMSYENIQSEAASAVKGVQLIIKSC